MGSSLDRIINSRINIMQKKSDYWWVSLDVGEMGIYNPVILYDTEGEKSIEFDKIVGERITKVVFEEGKYISIVLESDNKLIVSIEPDSYTGPEALSIMFNSGSFIVIN
jgi:hypothetical protein